MARKFPGQIVFDAMETWRIARIRAALVLHKLPSEIDEMTLSDLNDLFEVLWSDEQR